ncbi:MAG: hypothetical protein ABIJ11_00660 [Elusimicrobiota bacterium]
MKTGTDVDSTKSISVDIEFNKLVNAVKQMKKPEQELFIEDLLASTNPDYLASIKEAREDYQAGRVKTHKEIFGKTK